MVFYFTSEGANAYPAAIEDLVSMLVRCALYAAALYGPQGGEKKNESDIENHCKTPFAAEIADGALLVSPPYLLYMGFDKHENEELIRWGWPEDIWFHVDKLSSAHVYLRLHPGESIDDLPQAVIDDCAQLVKANSIQGNKQNDLEVVYTPWANLKKTANMDVGQVGFHKNKEVRSVKIEKRINEIVNRLNKTKKEEKPDFRALREERDFQERQNQRKIQQEQKQREKEEEKRKQEQAELRSYSSLMTTEKMMTNKDFQDDDDDFM